MKTEDNKQLESFTEKCAMELLASAFMWLNSKPQKEQQVIMDTIILFLLRDKTRGKKKGKGKG